MGAVVGPLLLQAEEMGVVPPLSLAPLQCQSLSEVHTYTVLSLADRSRAPCRTRGTETEQKSVPPRQSCLIPLCAALSTTSFQTHPARSLFDPHFLLRQPFHSCTMVTRPSLTQVGISAMSVYIPRTAVAQTDLEVFDKVPAGKYTIGLGQRFMSFVTDREDVVSLALTAVHQLVTQTNISYARIGRLEVGTETILDKSKSIKTCLMRLFEDSGNSEVEGLDNTNACYGGTAALFNALAWTESSAWDGRYAVVVATDIAVYEPGPARPTGGAAAVAMLIGPDAPIRFEIGLRATCMGHTYDFFKPRLGAEYPVVKGQETVDTFVHAMDECYDRFRARAKVKDGVPFSMRSVDYAVFHAPFNKMVQKSFARLLYSDFLASAPGEDPFFEPVEQFRGLERASSHRDRDAQRAFVALAKPMYEQKVAPGAWLGVEIGNCYTASLYSSLAALVMERKNDLIDKRILMYSFGSGFAASMFALRVVEPLDAIFNKLTFRERLKERLVFPAQEYDCTLKVREENYCRFSCEPVSPLQSLFPGTFYLKRVGELGEREYDRIPFR